jgi:regulator of protease activity HflC (stomatin/prohibitin superfamily)
MILIFLLIFLVVLVLSGLRTAAEWERGVIFFLGRIKPVRGPGLFYIIPILESVRKIDLRTTTVAIDTQETITRDNVSIKVNAVIWYKVTDPIKALVTVENFRQAVYQFTATNLRNMIGQHSLDEVLKERNKINNDLINILNSTVIDWGIEVDNVEIKDIEIPVGMQRAMAMEAEALREKRSRIIKASAEFEASEQLAAASKVIIDNPVALELRRMQMITEVGAEQNTTTIIMVPSDFIGLAKEANDFFSNKNKSLHEVNVK